MNIAKILEAHKAWLEGQRGGRRANLFNADLSCIDLSGANLENANLRNANLRDSSLVFACLKGADMHDANLMDSNLMYADLTGADLSYANFGCADLTKVNLTNANLTKAKLSNANLTNANMTGANLTGANLRLSNLKDTNLRDANLSDIKADFFAALATLPAEVPFLRKTLIDGNIDGSVYKGSCACLAGTMANACNASNFDDWLWSTPFPVEPYSPRERWFYAIYPSMTAKNSIIVTITVEWIDEFLSSSEA